ncbi:hypothetical protein [Hufsiella ginkgonis]|uniref:Uncharacterized protein n=1 Tax=Hufsiella ginkgonis TaxID=2695274 RepID=A0A7K1Y0W1_9SPHI|nr:hypothetical protein [Hufsiella ginkgonis]MXV16875.1 hypothetical protein [Hufsiella ginkgonis]
MVIIEVQKYLQQYYLAALGEETFNELQIASLNGRLTIQIEKSRLDKIEEQAVSNQKLLQDINRTADLNNLEIKYEAEGNVDLVIEFYEQNVAVGRPAMHAYDRLVTIYRSQKRYDHEIRVIKAAIKVWNRENELRFRTAIFDPGNIHIISEIEVAYQNCEPFRRADGRFAYHPYPVAKYSKRLQKVRVMHDKVNK